MRLEKQGDRDKSGARKLRRASFDSEIASASMIGKYNSANVVLVH